MKAFQYLSGLFLEIHIPRETITNTISKLRKCEDDASSFVQFLQERKSASYVEYLNVGVDEETCVLNSAVWSAKDSTHLVQRYGEIAFWDLTHNSTRYDYNLSSFTVIDSEGCSRAVRFSLCLFETAENCKILVLSWHEAFGVHIPQVIYTDGDEAMYAAIVSMPYSDEITHLICTFHLFDMNMKKRVQPFLTSANGTSSWPLFRKGISICREAQSATELQRL